MKNKILNKVLITLLSIVLIYTIFIIEESIRLEKNEGSRPLIVFKVEETKEGEELIIKETYYSLGFSLKMNKSLDNETSSDDNRIYNIYEEEFRLFNRILIWAWIS